MQIVYDFCTTADDQALVQKSLSFFNWYSEIREITKLVYYPKHKSIATHHNTAPFVKYWDTAEFNDFKNH